MTAKREKFIELAERRTKTALKAIRTIGKLANKTAYIYTEADIATIVDTLAREVAALEARMSSASKESIEFSLTAPPAARAAAE